MAPPSALTRPWEGGRHRAHVRPERRAGTSARATAAAAAGSGVRDGAEPTPQPSQSPTVTRPECCVRARAPGLEMDPQEDSSFYATTWPGPAPRGVVKHVLAVWVGAFLEEISVRRGKCCRERMVLQDVGSPRPTHRSPEQNRSPEHAGLGAGGACGRRCSAKSGPAGIRNRGSRFLQINHSQPPTPLFLPRTYACWFGFSRDPRLKRT